MIIAESLFEAYTEIDGAALLGVLNSNVTITGSRFMNMEITYGIRYSTGAIFYFEEEYIAEFCNTTLSGNTAMNISNKTNLQGGIIHAYGNLNISLCYVAENYGGVVALKAMNIERSVFRNNSAQYGVRNSV